MKTIWFVTSVLTGIVLMSASSSQAQSVTLNGWNGPLGMLGRYDSDQDNKVSYAEYETGRVMQFARMDKNGNGVLNFSEIDAVGRHSGEDSPVQAAIDKRIAVLKAADSNGDRKISPEEYKVSCAADFKSLDTDGDGFITPAEVAVAAL